MDEQGAAYSSKVEAHEGFCSSYFEDNCCEAATDIVAQFRFGIKLTRKLNVDAVPSIFFEEKAGYCKLFGLRRSSG